MTRPSTKLGVSIRICDSPSVKELLASTLRSYGDNTMRERGVGIAILGVDIAILGVDVATLGVDIAILDVDIAVLGAIGPRGCVAARAVETAEVAGARGCVAAETPKSRGWPKPGATSQRERQTSRG